MHEVCKKSAKHRIGMHEVTWKSAQLESKRKKVCTKCAWKWISHHLKCAKCVQNVKKCLHKVCKKSVKCQKKYAFFLPNAHFADLCTLLKKCARICPPMYVLHVYAYHDKYYVLGYLWIDQDVWRPSIFIEPETFSGTFSGTLLSWHWTWSLLYLTRGLRSTCTYLYVPGYTKKGGGGGDRLLSLKISLSLSLSLPPSLTHPLPLSRSPPRTG